VSDFTDVLSSQYEWNVNPYERLKVQLQSALNKVTEMCFRHLVSDSFRIYVSADGIFA